MVNDGFFAFHDGYDGRVMGEHQGHASHGIVEWWNSSSTVAAVVMRNGAS